MRYRKRIGLIGICLLTSATDFAAAQPIHKIHIINHFNNDLSFKITINPNVLPDLQQNFSLESEDSIHTNILDLQKEAYISVRDSANESAFWGVEIENSKPKFHGYIGKGIAYSWRNDIIIFCTPAEYKSKNSCF